MFSGCVIDQTSKEPIPYASLFVKGNINNGVSSNINGKFDIYCNPEDTLLVQCIGYKRYIFQASNLSINQVIRLKKEFVQIEEIKILAESAYNMLIRAKDNTIAKNKKSIQGYCIRHDDLLFNGNKQKTADAKIIFKSIPFKYKNNKTEYWLQELKIKSYKKDIKLPYLSYPNTVPLFFPSIIKKITEKKATGSNCSLKSLSDSLIVINFSLEKPIANFVNNFYFYINTNMWTFSEIVLKGDYQDKPIGIINHYYSSQIVLKYKNDRDSIALSKFSYGISFSRKKADLKKIWDYTTYMNIIYSNNIDFDFSKRKLKEYDYLLFKEE